jgi:ABC-2 type transport system permease protein
VLLGVTNLTVLPLTFLSTMIMTRDLMPGWIRTAAALNPVDWAVTMAREGFTGGDLGAAAVRFGLLAAFTAASWSAAALAFRRYQARS